MDDVMAPVTQSSSEAVILRIHGRSMTSLILVVDDDPTTRFLLRMIFETAGYLVGEAPDGIAAMNAIGKDQPDLLVTDMMMPLMDGGALMSRVRSDPQVARVPIVALSAEPDAKQAAVDADAFLAKPFDRSELLEVVGSLLAKGHPEAA